MKKSKIAQFVSIILKLLLGIGIVSLFFVPTLYDVFSSLYGETFNNQTIYYRIAFYLCAIFSLGIIYELISIFNSVNKGSPFKKATVVNLKIIAVLFMFLSIIIAVKIIFIPTIISISISLITFIASLAFYVLSQVLKAAAEYKNEVDYMV